MADRRCPPRVRDFEGRPPSTGLLFLFVFAFVLCRDPRPRPNHRGPDTAITVPGPHV